MEESPEKTKICLFVIVAFLAVGGSSVAEPPVNYLQRWNDLAVQKRIDEGIERNRQSNVKLTSES